MGKRLWDDEDKNFVALDLGTANVIAYLGRQGIIYNEPSQIAYNILTNSIHSIGKEAYEMLGKTNENIRVITPLVDGVIADLDAAKDLLRTIFARMNTNNLLKNALVVLACPSSVTELEKNALREVVKEMGTTDTDILVEEEVKLSAIGAGINIDSPRGSLVMDIGGGTTDIAVIGSGEIIFSKSIKIAGNFFDEEIRKYIRSEYNILIGPKTAETIKKDLGSLYKTDTSRKFKAFGRDIISGLPREVLISQNEIKNVLLSPFSKIVDLIVDILENTTPELAGDVVNNGLVVCGGGALIRGIDEYLKSIFQFKVQVAQEPLMTVIDGAKEYEKHIHHWTEIARLRKTQDFKL
ncbi:rod shape-determining protein [Spiroplasma endosymbiont of Crioceris asparagi]|uniref:rod shape-determining protein n=1 Tax=Spiroplasma endosymbiont of Crioceris asparagi TaxID=3066286 RepID=UPI0030CEB1D6